MTSRHPVRSAGSDRGQVLLLITFGIAVLLLVLGLLLGSAIHAGNAATAGDVAEDRPAASYQQSARQATERHVTLVNARNNSSYRELRSGMETNLRRWSDMAGRHDAVYGRTTGTSLVSTRNGTLAAQTNRSRALTNESGAGNWTLANGISGTRGFRLNVSRSSLVDAVGNDSNASALKNQGVFRIVVTANDTWTVFVYQNGSDELWLKVDDPSGGFSSACRASGGADGYVVVGVSNASLGNGSCPALSFFQELSTSHEIAYERGENATGSYGLVVTRPVDEVDDADFANETTGASPFATPAIYGATVRVEYGTTRTRYVANVTAVPGDGNA